MVVPRRLVGGRSCRRTARMSRLLLRCAVGGGSDDGAELGDEASLFVQEGSDVVQESTEPIGGVSVLEREGMDGHDGGIWQEAVAVAVWSPDELVVGDVSDPFLVPVFDPLGEVGAFLLGGPLGVSAFQVADVALRELDDPFHAGL